MFSTCIVGEGYLECHRSLLMPVSHIGKVISSPNELLVTPVWEFLLISLAMILVSYELTDKETQKANCSATI